MVRNYKRKTEKRDPAVIVRALRAIDSGMSVRAAAHQFNIPTSTLSLHQRRNTPTNEPQQSTLSGPQPSTENSQTITSSKRYIIKKTGGQMVCILI